MDGGVEGWMTISGFLGNGRTLLCKGPLPPPACADERFAVSRLYSKGRILGHKRAKRNSRPNTTLVQIEGVSTKEEAQFYLGKVRKYPSRPIETS
jgi:hypothetical protein